MGWTTLNQAGTWHANGHPHWCARTWSWLILATTGVRVRTSGVDCVPPDGSYVFVSNHQSIYDIPILFENIPFQLRIIAKSSRHEFFVFAQDLKEDRVEAGVRIVLSDGESIVAEGETDAGGVWRYRGEELRELTSLRAFARSSSSDRLSLVISDWRFSSVFSLAVSSWTTFFCASRRLSDFASRSCL